MALVEIGRFQTGFEADIVRGRLEEAGIAAFLFDTGMSAFVAGARLMVDEEDRDAALALLSAADGSAAD